MFNNLPFEEYFSHFKFLAIANKVAINTHLCFCVYIVFVFEKLVDQEEN